MCHVDELANGRAQRVALMSMLEHGRAKRGGADSKSSREPFVPCEAVRAPPCARASVHAHRRTWQDIRHSRVASVHQTD